MRPSREDLLGYLLGALDDPEMDQVEEALRRDADVRRELDALERLLEPLEGERHAGQFEPPAQLAERTCDYVRRLSDALDDASPLDELLRDSRAPRSPHASAAPRRAPTRRPMPEPPRSGGWKLSDAVTATGVLLGIALLFFPAIANSRYAARLAGCQNNLRELGVALTTFSDLHGGRFPYVAAEGNHAFAGNYAAVLHDYQLIEPRRLVCPSSALASRIDEWRPPTLEMVARASGAELARLQLESGGSYGYPLGQVVNGRHEPVRNMRRPQFPLMIDAPSLHLPHRHSANHGGPMHNVLFEDGHVRAVSGNLLDAFPGNDPLRNRLGLLEAGMDLNDAVIAPSHIGPFSPGRD